MTAEGRLARGKANYESTNPINSKRLKNNPETLAYVATLEPVKVEPKPKEKNQDGKPKSR